MPVSRSTPDSRHTLKVAAIAFIAGLLLFVLVWINHRQSDSDQDAPNPSNTLTETPAAAIKPLPAPLAASDHPPSDIAQTKQASPAEAPKPVDASPPAPPAAAPAPVTMTPPKSTPLATASEDRPIPLQEHMAPPRYPIAALRRGEAGNVLVHVEVDASGTPSNVTLLQRSGSRALDHAAIEAVRHWGFRPAQRDGHPVAGGVNIPFEFKPAQ